MKEKSAGLTQRISAKTRLDRVRSMAGYAGSNFSGWKYKEGSIPNLSIMTSDTNLDEFEIPKLSWGVGDADDWLSSKFTKDWYFSEGDLYCKLEHRITPVGFNLFDWTKKESNRFIFTRENNAYLIQDWGWVELYQRGRELQLKIYGVREEAEKWIKKQIEYGLEESTASIHWIYGACLRDSTISQLKMEAFNEIPGTYPWIKDSIADYAKGFFESSASILILIGPPGTGKTSFLKGLIKASKMGALVTYDTHLLQEDGLFARLMQDDDLNMMVLEDADTYLGSRRDTGNGLMHKFLNISNGLVSPLMGKKLIFTTNLPSTAEIDPALLRPGRCYEVLQFRPLNNKESNVVAKNLHGKDFPELGGKEYTLAEIANIDRVEATKQQRKVGFL